MLRTETPTSVISFDPSIGILKVATKAVNEITLENVHYDFQQAAELVNFRKTPVLADSREYTEFTADIREFYAGKEIAERISAMAIMVSSIATRLDANFFIKMHKPHFPTRLFTSEEEAIAWLGTFVTDEAEPRNPASNKNIR